MSTFDSKAFLATLTAQSGIYQMLDSSGKVLYVGKARHLCDRVASYFRSHIPDPKTRALVQQIAQIQITVTQTENEALLLESNLIKQLRPRYNILLRDDKSFPYLYLSTHDPFPRLVFHRGAQREKGEYFGPYPSAAAVHETLDLLQKIFKLRQCSDHFFRSRTRPCLQYQIQRCTAPCVGYISTEEYQQAVQHARLFLQGKNQIVLQTLAEQMNEAAVQLNFEQAARYRDQILKLRQMTSQHYMNTQVGDVDVIGIAMEHTAACVGVLYIRGGRVLGVKPYFPKIPEMMTPEEVLSAFLPQYYLNKQRGSQLPKQILIDRALSDADWIAAALSEHWPHAVRILFPKRGRALQWLKMAELNAQQLLTSHITQNLHYYTWLEALQQYFHLPNLPQRMECFDISHTRGEATVASCVVFGLEGPIKTAYRRFNITDITPGDDYAAMRQALTRRYTRLKAAGAVLPDILLIDGGRGQLSQAVAVLEELQVTDLMIMGVAKGEGRKPGLETVFVAGDSNSYHLPADSPALHLIQKIRDEAHRFAITGHRQKRAKARQVSILEQVSGIGPLRRRELLTHFGGLEGIKQASVTDLMQVSFVNADLAQRLYHHLRNRSAPV